MSIPLATSTVASATSNALESFKGFYDQWANPNATVAEKQAATFALASAFIAAGTVIRDSPLLKVIAPVVAGAGLANSLLQLKSSIEAWNIAVAGTDQGARQTAYVSMLDKSIGFIGSFGATVAAVPGLQVARKSRVKSPISRNLKRAYRRAYRVKSPILQSSP